VTDVRQFGDRGTRSFDCARCEAMLADAVDGALSVEEQQFFDAHIGECRPCEQLLAEAGRGAAWLEMLRTPAPEPPPALLEKILAQTAGAHAMLHPVSLADPAPAMAPGYGNVVPFPRRAAAAVFSSTFGRIVFEPRLAMTAAMAFLSIALTMDLMGVNPMDLRARDLSPSGVHRAFAQMDARVVQYYEGLRVVYELESRVHDFQNVQDNAQDAAHDAAPAQNQSQAPAAVTDPAQPSGENPADQTDEPAQQNQNKVEPQAAPNRQQPDSSRHEQHTPAPGNGVSRREETHPAQTRGTLAAFRRNHTGAVRQSLSDAALDDAVDDYLGGISSAVDTVPLRRHGYAERRAA